jgi:hypothetical protein
MVSVKSLFELLLIFRLKYKQQRFYHAVGVY